MYTPHANIPPMLPSETFGSLAIFDGIDTKYRFEIYGISETPARTNAVYMFCKFQNSTFEPVYIGRAEDLAARLIGHERVIDAMLLGASRLLVHVPGFASRIDYIEAER